MAWNEMKMIWSEMNEWNGMKLNEMWNEMKWHENEVEINESTWNDMKWNEVSEWN